MVIDSCYKQYISVVWQHNKRLVWFKFFCYYYDPMSIKPVQCMFTLCKTVTNLFQTFRGFSISMLQTWLGGIQNTSYRIFYFVTLL